MTASVNAAVPETEEPDLLVMLGEQLDIAIAEWYAIDDSDCRGVRHHRQMSGAEDRIHALNSAILATKPRTMAGVAVILRSLSPFSARFRYPGSDTDFASAECAFDYAIAGMTAVLDEALGTTPDQWGGAYFGSGSSCNDLKNIGAITTAQLAQISKEEGRDARRSGPLSADEARRIIRHINSEDKRQSTLDKSCQRAVEVETSGAVRAADNKRQSGSGKDRPLSAIAAE